MFRLLGTVLVLAGIPSSVKAECAGVVESWTSNIHIHDCDTGVPSFHTETCAYYPIEDRIDDCPVGDVVCIEAALEEFTLILSEDHKQGILSCVRQIPILTLLDANVTTAMDTTSVTLSLPYVASTDRPVHVTLYDWECMNMIQPPTLFDVHQVREPSADSRNDHLEQLDIQLQIDASLLFSSTSSNVWFEESNTPSGTVGQLNFCLRLDLLETAPSDTAAPPTSIFTQESQVALELQWQNDYSLTNFEFLSMEDYFKEEASSLFQVNACHCDKNNKCDEDIQSNLSSPDSTLRVCLTTPALVADVPVLFLYQNSNVEFAILNSEYRNDHTRIFYEGFQSDNHYLVVLETLAPMEAFDNLEEPLHVSGDVVLQAPNPLNWLDEDVVAREFRFKMLLSEPRKNQNKHLWVWVTLSVSGFLVLVSLVVLVWPKKRQGRQPFQGAPLQGKPLPGRKDDREETSTLQSEEYDDDVFIVI